MTKIISLIFSVIVCFSGVFGQTKVTKFKIDGKVIGFSNGTKLYLHDLSEGSYKKIDSAFITNGKFSFSGHIKTKYLKSSITTTDFADRVSFWIENGLTSFFAEKGNFNKAIIKGSIIQADQNRFNKLLDTAKNTKEAEFHFVKSNPKSVISAYVLSVYCSTWAKDTISNLYKSFSKEMKATDFGKKIFDSITLNRDIKVGDKFVDFSQKDTSNNGVKLSDFKDKVVLLEFWGSWCGPCREGNPSLVKIYNEFKLKGFAILGVASETDKKQWLKAIKMDGLLWTNVTDLKGNNNKAAIIYGVSGYPTNFLIDRNGTIIAKNLYGDDLRNWLAKNL